MSPCNLYVSTQNSNVIQKITSGGSVTTFATLPGTPITTILTSGTSWTVPANWSNASNTIEVVGGGGYGGAPSYGAGGGGAYAKISNLSLTPGNSVTYQIGNGSSGTDTYFNGTGSTCAAQSVCAQSGASATVFGGPGGAGGLAASSVGTVKYSGGSASYSAGGGAAGFHGAGINGGAGDNGFGGSYPGGAGAEWGAAGSGGGGGNTGSSGSTGGNYGAGGGSGSMSGSLGTPGVIVITYNSGLNSPHALAFDSSGNLYTANYGGNTVSKINSSGTVVATYVVDNAPIALVFDSGGNLYTANVGSNTISKITSAGAVSTFVPMPAPPTMSILTSGTSWAVPYNWGNVGNAIEAIGAGGNGVSTGGNGGAYAKISNLALTPGNSVTYQIGSYSGGGDTYFNGSGTTCSGQSVCAQSGNAGGSAASSIGTVKYSGGSGGSSLGGGGAAGPYGPGIGVGSGGGAGDNGFGGLGGAYATGSGNPGGAGTEWGSVGSGGGGGGGSMSIGGNGGLYGGAGGGGSGFLVTGAPGLIVVTYGGTLSGPYSLAIDSSGYLYAASFNPNTINKIFPIVTAQTSFTFSVGLYTLTGPSYVLSGTAPTLTYKVMPNTQLFYLYSNVSGLGNWLYGPGHGAYPETGTIVGHTQTVAETYQIYPYDGVIYTVNPPATGAGPTVPVAILTAPTATLSPSSQTITSGSTATLTYTLGGGPPTSMSYKVDGGATTTIAASPFVIPSTLLPANITPHSVVMTVGNAAGTTTSNTVSITVNTVVGPAITATPSYNTSAGSETVTVTNAQTSDYVFECPAYSTNGGLGVTTSCRYGSGGYQYLTYQTISSPNPAPLTFALPATSTGARYNFRLYNSGATTDLVDSSVVTIGVPATLSSFGGSVAGISFVRVRKGGTVTLTWGGSGLPSCSVSSVPAVATTITSNTATGGSATTSPITAPTSFTLTCGALSKQILVKITPILNEI